MEHLTSASPPGPAASCRSVELPLAGLLWHEEIEPGRLSELAGQLATQGLREPVHVVATPTGHLIVDGAHRARAMTLLGRETVRAHLLSLAAEQPVPGWTHVVSDRAGERLMERARQVPATSGSRTARPIAQITGPGGTGVVWTLQATREGRLGDAREVAALYQHEPYLRHPAAEALPVARWAVTWVLPPWGELCRTVEAHGPFPAGVTRLGSAIDAACPGRRQFAEVRRSA